jgi:amino acid transporter
MNDRGRFSLLGAWALAFGCALGWDALSIPWTTLLPAAGPLGTAIGVLLGGLAMALVAWNFHFLLNRRPGPGGVYAYAKAAFGVDHGFLCAWFLCLTYAAIVWGDAAVLVLVARFAFGDIFRFGPSWTVAGLEVFFGEALLSVGAAAVTAALTARMRRAVSGLPLP